jgi:DNA polymerase-3 subunit epsilon/ATP-dependent DNA helicase DinG
MARTYVAVDVETTGLDSVRDEIIEVAAITFEGADITDEFVSLVNPRTDIPPFISKLTGITDAMVTEAPVMSSLRATLKRKLADHVIVGHNVEFDLSFLRANQLGYGNHRLDTVTLATILVPEAGRYGLEALAYHLDFPPPPGSSHRAGIDANTTIELFLALRERALRLSLAQLEEIVQAGSVIGWPEALFFEDVLAERARHAFQGDELRQRGQLPKLYVAPPVEGQPVVPEETPTALDIAWLTELIMPGGHFEREFPGFEYRLQQVAMMQAVATAFNEGRHVLVEAGTGTGKSLGYLLPSAFWATENGRRVVISTNTINLQDQLMSKDIPALRDTLRLDLRAAVRKGRSNYICTRLFQQMRRSGPTNADEMALYAKVLLWLPTTQTGDVSEVSLRGPGERAAWAKLNGDNQVCTSEQCASENCPLHVARRSAELAHLVIVNHALLLADMTTGNLVLPDYVDLIIDEAHHLESAVTSGLSFRTDRRAIDTIVDEAMRPRAGLVGNAQQRISAVAPVEVSRAVDALAERMRSAAQVATIQLDDFFTTLDYFLQGLRQGKSQFADPIRLTSAVRVQPEYYVLEESWESLNLALKPLTKDFSKLAEAVADCAASYGIEDEEELRAALLDNGKLLENIRTQLDALISDPQPEMIYWVEYFRENVSLHVAPLHVGPLVEEHIFGTKETVVLTSATLRTAGYGRQEPSFDYLRDRLHAHDADELAVGSPFDYRRSTLLYLVSDIPEPNQPGYQRALEQAIIDVATTLGGRTLVLFTSNKHLSDTAEAIESALSRQGITTLAQTSGGSRQQLLDQFRREDSRSVLLGTRSFWEGVDVPGPALEGLIIARLPFDVPSDPVFAARSETYENAFFEYSIPEAVLRFRQGFGRLIRRVTDEGVVVVLDKRVLSKRYGELFIEALPECTVIRQRGDRINELLVRWAARDRTRV